jgi:hypothetical protein
MGQKKRKNVEIVNLLEKAQIFLTGWIGLEPNSNWN